MAGDTVTAECRNGHEDTYPGPPGRAVKCRACRVSVWLKKPPAGMAVDASVWADETPWQPDAIPAGEAASEPCGTCGGDQVWTPGRTALRCDSCNVVTLPAAVQDARARAAEQAAQTVRTSAVVALTPEQELDALIRFEARQNSTVSALRKAADRLKDPAAYLEDPQDRKNAADTASALRTLARLASEAQDGGRLDLIEEKATTLAPSIRWFVARLEAESEDDEYEDEEDEYEYEDDEYEDVQPGQIVPARVADSYRLPRQAALPPTAFIPRSPNTVRTPILPATRDNSAYLKAQQERAANLKAQQEAEMCEGKHRTLGIFPYHPKVQYRLWKVEQQPYAWDGYGVPTFAGSYVTSPVRTHVMDGCYACMQKAAGDEPGYEYEKLWTGPNPSMSFVPAGIVLLVVVGLIVAVKINASRNASYYSSYWGYSQW